MKIGIYGGSFNPVHYGHLQVARAARAALGLDRLLIVPAAVSPFKAGQPPDDTPAILAKHRMDLLHAVFDHEPNTSVDERELVRGGVSYAIDTVRELAAEHPGATLFFVIGADSAPGLPRWKDWCELQRLCHFVTFPRTRESSTEIRELFQAAGVTGNPDPRIEAAVRRGLEVKHGFCPCRLEPKPEFFCPCDEFKGQMRDPSYHGPCHCRLYHKP